MNLDDFSRFSELDSDGMYQHIHDLPEQFEKAWNYAQNLPLNDDLARVRQVLVCGMGGSAIGGDLLASAVGDRLELPILVNRGYDLPAWVLGDETLVVASSFSGNTEETLAAYQQATERGARVIGITTGGRLAELLAANGQTAWVFPDEIGHPRAALGWSLALLLALVWRLGWANELDEEFAAAIATMKTQRDLYLATIPADDNPAKGLATQLVGRLPIVVGGGNFETIARRWKCQINENANTAAVFEALPEMNHNTVVGVDQPAGQIDKIAMIFISSEDYDHPRLQLRHELSANLMQEAGLHVTRVQAKGESLLAQLLHTIILGDFLSFYLAMAYDVDPAIIAPIKSLKEALKGA